MRKIGYSDTYSTNGHCAKMFGRSDVIGEIRSQRLELIKKTGFTKEQAHAELDENRRLALDQKQPSAATQASTAKIRLYGMDQMDNKRDATVIIINPPNQAKTVEVIDVNSEGE